MDLIKIYIYSNHNDGPPRVMVGECSAGGPNITPNGGCGVWRVGGATQGLTNHYSRIRSSHITDG